jgi:hypothetical protein
MADVTDNEIPSSMVQSIFFILTSPLPFSYPFSGLLCIWVLLFFACSLWIGRLPAHHPTGVSESVTLAFSLPTFGSSSGFSVQSQEVF